VELEESGYGTTLVVAAAISEWVEISVRFCFYRFICHTELFLIIISSCLCRVRKQ